jgi:hypothetical protein
MHGLVPLTVAEGLILMPVGLVAILAPFWV